jgi:hypothetical protein
MCVFRVRLLQQGWQRIDIFGPHYLDTEVLGYGDLEVYTIC